MINRNIFKVEISTKPISEERKKELTLQISEQLDIPLSEARYFISTPSIEKNMYDEADDSIDILYNDGSIKNIAEASDMLNISLLSKKVKSTTYATNVCIDKYKIFTSGQGNIKKSPLFAF